MRVERFAHRDTGAGIPDGRLYLEGRGGSVAVRRALIRVLAHPLMACEGPRMRGTVEIVLAEVLNNVIEHAYAGGTGRFEIRGRWLGGNLCLQVRDWGRALPGERLPEGLPLDPWGGGDPPEGGFGWYLIRSLSVGLRYRRQQDSNKLLILLLPEQ